MLLALPLPDFGSGARCTLLAWHVAAGAQAMPGAALLDLRVDLSAGLVQDCPPVTTCRIVLREAAWLRLRLAEPGEPIAAGGSLALLSTDATTPLDGLPARAVRCTVAAILHHADWWAGDA